jgi:hypothetical protein
VSFPCVPGGAPAALTLQSVAGVVGATLDGSPCIGNGMLAGAMNICLSRRFMESLVSCLSE